MLKNWKSLFIKTEDQGGEIKSVSSNPHSFSFPINNASTSAESNAPVVISQETLSDPSIREVIEIYENGLDSINMAGYDFYEFYQSINSTGFANEQAYNMAFHMAKTLDKTITPQKLLHDAEFYISKINEVHSQYVTQGQQKLNSLNDKRTGEKNQLNSEIDQASRRITQLKAELLQLETDINNKRAVLSKIDNNYYPQEKSVKEKLSANDFAKKTSIDKLNAVKDGILRFIKA